MWPALYSSGSRRHLRASITHHVGTDHTADGVLTACQSRVGVGVDLYAGPLYAATYGTSQNRQSDDEAPSKGSDYDDDNTVDSQSAL